MPQPKKQWLRLLVPAIVFAVGIGVMFAVYKGATNPAASTTPASTPTPTTTPSQQPAAQTPAPATPSAAAPGAPQPTVAGAPQAPAAPAPAIPAVAVPTTGYHAVPPSPPAVMPSIGDKDENGQYDALIDFSKVGAGIKAVTLAKHYETIKREKHVEVQTEHEVTHPGAAPDVLAPFAALAIEITPAGAKPVMVLLVSAWQASTDHPGRFEATIADDAGTPVLRLTREYTLAPGTAEIVLSQHVANLSKSPLTVRWFQNGPIDLPQDAIGYGGDKRRVRFGYLLPPEKDPAQSTVLSSDFLMPRNQALEKRDPVNGLDGKPITDADGQPPLWPNKHSVESRYGLVWSGMTNRYFGVAFHPLINSGASKSLGWVEIVSRVVLDNQGERTMALRLEGKPYVLAAADSAGAVADFSLGVYAGPLNRTKINENPLFLSLGLGGIVAYNFGGPCSWCTFAPVTGALQWFLHLLYDKVFQDWSLSIIVLVLMVRTCLHPLVKWQQIKMARFSKQMQAMAPKQKVLQEKYKDDQKKLQEETAKLWREEGISASSFIGCLTMFLQMPIWYAMSALLYFSAEFRHQPAFYGLFQMQPKSSPFWQFLGDLAESDRLLYFPDHAFTVPLIGGMIGPISSLNILPMLMGVVFFLQQKYLTPPTTATMTPEQEFQMKMMRWLSIFMMPLVMYNAPSGLAMYFMCSSGFAILESRYIRSHMAAIDAKKGPAAGAGTSVIDRKGGPKKLSFMARLQDMAEQKQQEARKRAGLPPGRPKR